MQTEIIEMMRTQVRAIHRALTGDDLPEREPVRDALVPESLTSDDDLVRRFFELDAATRTLPSVAARVPPFSFTPALDVIAGDDAVVLELAVPGVERDDIAVERVPGGLVISGLRRDPHGGTGRTFHAEIPRGPFRRAVPLPVPVEGELRMELDRGVLRIFLATGAATSATPDRSSTTGEQRE